jgi:hypothetical protein
MATADRFSPEIRALMTDVMDVRVIKDVPEGIGGIQRTVRVGDVVTLSRRHAQVLIAAGQAIRWAADEVLRANAADASSSLVTTTVARPPVGVEEIATPQSRRRRCVGILPLPPDGWDLVTESRLNALLVGPRHVTARLVRVLRPQLARPVIRVLPHLPLALPPADRVGTIVLEDVGRWDVMGQTDLLEWLGGAPGARMISTSTIPLLPMVDARMFSAVLYYRLNLIYVRC